MAIACILPKHALEGRQTDHPLSFVKNVMYPSGDSCSLSKPNCSILRLIRDITNTGCLLSAIPQIAAYCVKSKTLALFSSFSFHYFPFEKYNLLTVTPGNIANKKRDYNGGAITHWYSRQRLRYHSLLDCCAMLA